LLVQAKESSGRSAGLLYFVSTFGSAAGTILTSFYLVKWFRIDSILGGMIAVSIVLAAVAALVGGRSR
jgi:hypothetical protein